MKAMLSEAPGGPETLVLRDLPMPDPAKGEVRIAVKAAGVNFPDTLIIRDLYQFKPPRPFAPGGEIAGVIDALGAGVDGFKLGDRVLALPSVGGFASHLVCNAKMVMPIPDNMPFDQAACFIFTYGTSHYALKDRGELQTGETLLVLGAAGGVGAAAIELGKAMGARVIAAVSSKAKAEFCRQIGADEVVIYPRNMDRDAQKAFSADLKSAAGKAGIDVIYDAVGGDYAEPALRSINWAGRFLVVGFPAGIPKIPLNLTLLKSCQIVGIFWGAFTLRDPKAHAENLAELFTLYADGKIRPQVTATFPLEQAAEALEYIQDRKVLGKVALVME